MAYEEAAASLGVKVGTVKSRVNRARHRLAELMGLTSTVT
jgi:RNA polymerase sigma-70 factor (ECF subfamily)